jgi:hydroxypyruvate isomerase
MTDQEIIKTFHQIFIEWACRDIESGIKNEQNYLVALGLFSYLEFLGGLVTGNGGTRNHSEKNFQAAVQLLPQEYRELDSKLIIEDANGTKHPGLYGIIRCGLSHEYGIKGTSAVYNDPQGRVKNHPGIQIETMNDSLVIVVHTNELFRNFKNIVDDIYKKLQNGDRELLTKMGQTLTKIVNRKFIIKQP